MAEAERFKNLEQQIEAVLESESNDFFEMAVMLGLDPIRDFASADLSGIDLSGKDLVFANFTGTNLQGADLSYTALMGADFTEADLSSPLLVAVTQINERANSVTFSNSDLEYDLDLALGQNSDLDLADEITRNRTRFFYRALDLAYTLDSTFRRSTDFYQGFALALNLDLSLYLDLALTVDLTRDLPRRRNYGEDVLATFNRVQNQYLGTTFRGANLEGTSWLGANLMGTVMIGCQGLTPDEIIDLKERGVIFDDTPDEDSYINSRSPVPV